MEITEVRIKLMEDGSDRLKAFCSITFDDCFVVRDLKIIEGTNGPFVAMPSRKLTSHCPGCGCKNHLRAGHCNQCGRKLLDDRTVKDEDGRTKLYADIAHPINSACRELIQQRVIEEYGLEIDRAHKPGYVSRYDDFEFDTPEPHFQPSRAASAPPAAREPSAAENTTRIEPPQQGSSGPHTSGSGAPRRGPTPKTAPDSFGDGIL